VGFFLGYIFVNLYGQAYGFFLAGMGLLPIVCDFQKESHTDLKSMA
jgi:hypothetical protein